jgi:Ca2+-binding RTX toxin-like protein
MGNSAHRNGVAGRRLLLEGLEQRRLLAVASIDLVGDVLEISGTGNDDMISLVYEDPADVVGNVIATVRKSSGALLVQETYDRMDVASLVVRAGGGRDGVSNTTNVPDVMEGGEGNDVLRGGSGDSALYGGNGDDTLVGGLGMDLLFGDAGRDQLFADGTLMVGGQLKPKSLEQPDIESLEDALEALADADLLSGGSEDDLLYGGGGMDLLLGGDGNDTLSGAECVDLLFGQAGDDVLLGGAGDDYLNGGRGRDKLSGNDGNDILYGGDLNALDELRGGAGNDQFVFGGTIGQALWEQEVRDFNNNEDEWIYLWLLSDEDVQMYTQPALE